MRIDVRLLCLHIKKQWYLYAVALLLIYVILLSQQNTILQQNEVNEKDLKELYELAQKYLLLVVLWWDFLAFRIIKYRESLEVVIGFSKTRWWLENYVLYVIIFLPYYMWFSTRKIQMLEMIPYLLIQTFLFGCFIYIIMRLFHSALVGLAAGMLYYFLIWNDWLPLALRVVEFGLLPQYDVMFPYLIKLMMGLFLVSVVEKKSLRI